MNRLIFIIGLFAFVMNAQHNSVLAMQKLPFDEGKIVFSSGQVKKSIENIFVIDSATGKVSQLTKKGINLPSKWSTDGRRIAFEAYARDGHNNSEIYVMDADGRNQYRLTYTTNGNASEPRWGISGHEIIFHLAVKGELPKEAVIDLRTLKNKQMNTAEYVTIKTIHGINDYIDEFYKNREGASFQSQEEAKSKTDSIKKAFENRKGFFKFYPSPAQRFCLLYYDVVGQIVLLDMESATQIELKSQKASHPAWSKDGKKIAYVNGDEGDYFLIYDVDKNQYSEVKFQKDRDAGCGGELSWSRNSRKIVYSCGIDYKEDSSWLYILDLETKKSTKLIRGNSPDWY